MINRLTIGRRDALATLAFAAFRGAAFAQKGPAFPKGAIIRTVLKDIAPEELAGGATLFHEHMSLAEDFLPRWVQFQRAARAAAGGTGAANPASGRGAAPATPPPAAPATPQKLFMDDIHRPNGRRNEGREGRRGCLPG
jgi:hypothetical protein